jgi:hypothetical protein
MMQPSTMSGAVAKPNSSAPSAAAHVARREDAGDVRAIVRVGGHGATRADRHAEVAEQSVLRDAGEAHREQHEIDVERELAPRHLDELRSIRSLLELDAHGVQPLHAPVLSLELGRRDAPVALTAFLVGVARAQLHRPMRPRRRLGAVLRWLREELELEHLRRALTMAGADAIGPGVAAADDDDALSFRRDRAAGGDDVARDAAVLLHEILHGEVHAAELAAAHAQLARDLRAAGEEHGVELVAQLLDVQVAPHLDPRLEHDALGPHLMQAQLDHLLLELEVGDAVAEQPPDAVVLLENRDGVAHAPELLRRGETCRSGADDGDAKARVGSAGQRHDPALLERLVGDRLLDVADGDGLLDESEHARRLTRRRAQAAGQLGEVVRRVQRERRVPPAARLNESVPLRNDVLNGTAGVALTEGDAAIHAACTLCPEMLIRRRYVELPPVLRPFVHRPPLRLGALDREEPSWIARSRHRS